MGSGNPFRPGFGKQPPTLAGRGTLTARIRDAMSAGPNSVDYAMLLTGIRGCGKTAFMGAARADAAASGWGIIKVTATGDGQLELAIRERATQREARPARRPQLRRRAGRLLGGPGAKFETGDIHDSPVVLADTLRRAGRRAAAKRRGVLLTVDELPHAHTTEIRRLAAAVQEVAGEEELPVALLAAGLPTLAEIVDTDTGMAFFQRCGRATLGLLDDDNAARALSDPIAASGKQIDVDALAEAVRLTAGYPYKLQLLGYHCWDNAEDGGRITRGVVHGAAYTTEASMLAQIVLPIWAHLDADQRDTLAAMASDADISRTADVAARVGVSEPETREQFRSLEVVGAVERLTADECRFVHPLMRGWINGDPHAAAADTGGRRVFPEDRSPRRSLKERILAVHAAQPQMTNAAIARHTGGSRSYVGKVLQAAQQR